MQRKIYVEKHSLISYSCGILASYYPTHLGWCDIGVQTMLLLEHNGVGSIFVSLLFPNQSQHISAMYVSHMKIGPYIEPHMQLHTQNHVHWRWPIKIWEKIRTWFHNSKIPTTLHLLYVVLWLEQVTLSSSFPSFASSSMNGWWINHLELMRGGGVVVAVIACARLSAFRGKTIKEAR